MNEDKVKVQENQETVATPEAKQSTERTYVPRGDRNRGDGNKDNKDGRERRGRRPREVKEDDGLIKKTVSVNRVVKVVKGGRTMRFSAVVVVGDGNGKVGIGTGKSGEVPQAIEKATQRAKNSMIEIARMETTIPHEIIGKFGRGHVLLLPAQKGTGVIAGGSVRNVLEAAGIKDIRTKSYGSNTPINCAKATLEGLKQLRTAQQVAALRGKTVEEL